MKGILESDAPFRDFLDRKTGAPSRAIASWSFRRRKVSMGEWPRDVWKMRQRCFWVTPARSGKLSEFECVVRIRLKGILHEIQGRVDWGREPIGHAPTLAVRRLEQDAEDAFHEKTLLQADARIVGQAAVHARGDATQQMPQHRRNDRIGTLRKQYRPIVQARPASRKGHKIEMHIRMAGDSSGGIPAIGFRGKPGRARIRLPGVIL
jgi:hypothetical protein